VGNAAPRQGGWSLFRRAVDLFFALQLLRSAGDPRTSTRAAHPLSLLVRNDPSRFSSPNTKAPQCRRKKSGRKKSPARSASLNGPSGSRHGQLAAVTNLCGACARTGFGLKAARPISNADSLRRKPSPITCSSLRQASAGLRQLAAPAGHLMRDGALPNLGRNIRAGQVRIRSTMAHKGEKTPYSEGTSRGHGSRTRSNRQGLANDGQARPGRESLVGQLDRPGFPTDRGSYMVDQTQNQPCCARRAGNKPFISRISGRPKRSLRATSAAQGDATSCQRSTSLCRWQDMKETPRVGESHPPCQTVEEDGGALGFLEATQWALQQQCGRRRCWRKISRRTIGC